LRPRSEDNPLHATVTANERHRRCQEWFIVPVGPQVREMNRVCQTFCVSDFCEGGFGFAYIQNESSFARTTILLGRTERSSPNAA
jgi:hypothetical protein